MTCDKCKYFKIVQEPLRTTGTLWDMGRAVCNKHNLITDFADHRKFERLDTCEDYENKALDKIRAEISEYKDDKIIHAERNEMIDIVLDIIDKYKGEQP